MPERTITVVRAGIGTTVQDHGRVGLAHLGVPRSGPVDRPLADLVTRAVGGLPGGAVFETAGSLVLRADVAVSLAASTAIGPISLAPGEQFVVRSTGVRNYEYVAVRGGLVVERVLGSSSHDTLSGIGPPPVVDGQTVTVGADPGVPVAVDAWPVRAADGPVRVWPGPRPDLFDDDALATFCSSTWTVATDLSRVGMRLHGGSPPRRTHPDDLPSEGLVLGAVQLPPHGEPVIMLADHPTTGGYPVVAVVDPADLPSLAQRRPGAVVRFVVRR